MKVSYSNSVLNSRQNTSDSYLDGLYMPFRPEYIQKLSFEINKFDFSLDVDYQNVGKRYELTANTKWTDPYQILDANLGYTLFLGRFVADFQFGLRNILDERYELLKGYPVAGRNLYLTMKFSYKFDYINNEIK